MMISFGDIVVLLVAFVLLAVAIAMWRHMRRVCNEGDGLEGVCSGKTISELPLDDPGEDSVSKCIGVIDSASARSNSGK